MCDQPNVAVILCDQLRRGALRCAGDPNVETPNLDNLASNGVRFSRSYSTYPICVPTRYSFVTGNYAHTRSVPGIDWRLPPTERTIADEFNDAGYQTAYIGKWHLSGHHPYRYSNEIDQPERTKRINRTPVPPELQGGFEYWRGFELRNNHFDTAYYVDDDPTPRLIDGHQTDGVVDLGIDYLDYRNDTRPFCLVTSIEAPHPPFQVPEPYYEQWRDRAIDLPQNFDDHDELHGGRGPRTETILEDIRLYYAMVEQLDDAVGRFLQALEERSIRDQTAVIFLSDHGELLGCHGRIGKKDPYEPSAGVPFIVSHPNGEIDDGRVLDTPTSTEDWFPTLLGLAGLDPRDPKPGTDLTPLARGDQRALNRAGVLLEFVREDRPNSGYAEETWRGFCTERYKYTVKGGMRGGEPWQLFDLEEDPYEQENLLAGDPPQSLAEDLHGYLRDTLAETGDLYPLKPAFGHDGLNLPAIDAEE